MVNETEVIAEAPASAACENGSAKETIKATKKLETTDKDASTQPTAAHWYSRLHLTNKKNNCKDCLDENSPCNHAIRN